MEQQEQRASTEGAGELPPSPGELVVQNGRLAGARCPLMRSLTLIGKDDRCNVRLNVEGVSPFHCALVNTATGLLLRDLDSDSGTLLNGETVSELAVNDGDLLDVGPFRFKIRLEPVQTEAGPIRSFDLSKQNDALRIQTAAVAAQQAALAEQEARLDQRKLALQKQEQQLASHLEEKQQRLVELQQQISQARGQFREERSQKSDHIVQLAEELEKRALELKQGEEQLLRRRKQIARLRKKLRLHHSQLLSGDRSRVQKSEKALIDTKQSLAKEADRLEKDRQTLQQLKLRWNGELELGKRQLQTSWDELHQQQRDWLNRRGKEQADLNRQAHTLEAKQQSLETAERALTEQQHLWAAKRLLLEQETKNLHTRIAHQREQLASQEQQAERVQDALRALTVPLAGEVDERSLFQITLPESEADKQRVALLEQIAGSLADQRLQLAEQCAELLSAHSAWHQEHGQAVLDLEIASKKLEEREQALETKQQSVLTQEQQQADLEAQLQVRQQQAEQLRVQLVAWQTQLKGREQLWVGERGRLLEQLQQQHDRLAHQEAELTQLRKRWSERRRQELTRHRDELARCSEARQKYKTLWQQTQEQSAKLVQEQRVLDEKTLALEELRLEVLGQTAQTPALEKQLQRLQRRVSQAHTQSLHTLAKEHDKLHTEAERLTQQTRTLDEQRLSLEAREADLNARLASWEQEHVASEQLYTRQRDELERLQAQRAGYEKQLAELRAELENLANSLLQEGEPLFQDAQAA